MNINDDGEYQEVRRLARATDKEIKEIKNLIQSLSTDSVVNKSNLSHISKSYDQLVKDNTLTHYKLFARTEEIKLELSRLKALHDEHVKHEQHIVNSTRHRAGLVASWSAVGLSLLAIIITLVTIVLKKAS